MRLIGIDCATDDARVGVALGEYRRGELDVLEFSEHLKNGGAVKLISGWLKRSGPALLAIDAPLGWPALMGKSLAMHRAGARITTPKDAMFRRETDRVVHNTLGKRPLDVGADRIARTAHAALAMLDDIRTQTGLPIPLSWNPKQRTETATIEVYPAATLAAHRLISSGYKKDDQRHTRQRIVESLRTVMSFPKDVDRLLECPDVLDAAVCLLSAKDFLDGRAMPPTELQKAKREGWIWVSALQEVHAISVAPDGSVNRVKSAPPPTAARRFKTSGDVITVVKHLGAGEVAGRRVLCPACNDKVFENWPVGWDSHVHKCSGLRTRNASGRKSEFKTRFRHLFR